MKKNIILLALLYFILVQCSNAASLPPAYTQLGFGVNIHSSSYTYQDLDLIKDTGFKVIRTDFLWYQIEKKKGVYDFSVFDQLLPAFAARGITPYLIVAYGNPLYQCTMNVNNQSCLDGYKNFVRQAVTRYKKYNVVWEIWNEPDCAYFWQPQPSYDAYMSFVKEIVPVIKGADSAAIVVAPAASNFNPPYTFLEECFKRGLLNYIDAISVHPYRDPPAETVVQDYANLRNLIKKYSPTKPNIPIIAGEWGESSAEGGRNEASQAKYLLRMYLTNLYQGIPITIWYDWKNDGSNIYNKDNNWGLISYQGYVKKQAAVTFKGLMGVLNRVQFVKRVSYPDANVYILQFNVKNSTRKVLYYWITTGTKEIRLSNGLTLVLTDSPKYIEVDQTVTIQ